MVLRKQQDVLKPTSDIWSPRSFLRAATSCLSVLRWIFESFGNRQKRHNLAHMFWTQFDSYLCHDLIYECWYMKVLDTIWHIFVRQVAAKIELQQGKAVWVPSGGAAVWWTWWTGSLCWWTGAAVWWTAKLELVNLGNCQPVWKDGWSLIRGPVVLWNVVLFQNSFLSGNFSCGSF